MFYEVQVKHNESSRIHCAQRFRERFGVELTPKLKASFFRAIERQENAYLVRMYNNTEVHFVMMRNVSPDPIVVVFRRDMHEIVTFMPPEYYRGQVLRRYREGIQAREERVV